MASYLQLIGSATLLVGLQLFISGGVDATNQPTQAHNIASNSLLVAAEAVGSPNQSVSEFEPQDDKKPPPKRSEGGGGRLR